MLYANDFRRISWINFTIDEMARWDKSLGYDALPGLPVVACRSFRLLASSGGLDERHCAAASIT